MRICEPAYRGDGGGVGDVVAMGSCHLYKESARGGRTTKERVWCEMGRICREGAMVVCSRRCIVDWEMVVIVLRMICEFQK